MAVEAGLRAKALVGRAAELGSLGGQEENKRKYGTIHNLSGGIVDVGAKYGTKQALPRHGKSPAQPGG